MRIFIFLLVFNFIFSLDLKSQEVPETEIRAVWIATVLNLDWPVLGQDAEYQKSSLINMLDSLKEININTVFFQIRAECDALYESQYEPWSRYLTGTQGVNPGYDPLNFAITECHKRGIELHAWLNPYRINVSTVDGGSYYAETNIYKEHPDWALIYSNGKKILNPGLPVVQKYIKQIAGDIINKYDIDGIHFDDYFYSYDGTPISLDNSTYQTYGSQYQNIGDFRRASINKMIKEVFDTIMSIKPYIRFGVSPFGIYGNNMNPPGITGFDAYNGIYCDPLAWLNEGTVDYIVPQLYWTTGGSQDFGKLLPWWAEKVFLKNRHVFAGHGIYRLSDNSPESFFDFSSILIELKDFTNLSNVESLMIAGWSLEEIVKQINIVRQNSQKGALGSVFFRAKDFERVQNLKKYIFNNSYFLKSVLPAQSWKNTIKPVKVSNIRLERIIENGILNLVWDGGNPSDRYAIYAIKNLADTSEYFKNKNLIDISFGHRYIPQEDLVKEDIYLGIVPYNRYWTPGDHSEIYKITKPEAPVLINPDNEALVGIDEKLKWNGSDLASRHYIEISTVHDFRQNKLEFITSNSQLEINNLNIEGEKIYFWRVRSSNLGGYSPYSEVRSFKTSFPPAPLILDPPDNAENIELYPEFTFSYSQNTEKIYIQISKSEFSFDIYNILDTIIDVQKKFRINKKLEEFTEYFVRVKAKSSFGESKWSIPSRFKTYFPLPDETQIFSPQNNSILIEDLEYVQISWFPANKAVDYKIQISDLPDFSSVIQERNIENASSASYYFPVTKTWLYVRVAGMNQGGVGPWSQVIRFILDNNYNNTEEKILKENEVKVFPNPCTDDLYIEVADSENIGKFYFEFFNNIGIKLHEDEFWFSKENRIFKFDTKQMICQLCYLRITNNKNTQTLKFLKH